MTHRLFAGPAMLLLVSALPLWAQANFTVSSTSTAIVAQGYTGLVGKIELKVVTGTTSATPLIVRYAPFPITNSLDTGIIVAATGGLSSVTVSLDRANNSLILNIPAGGLSTDTLTIDGVRVSPVGGTAKTATATILSPATGGNTIK